MSKSTTKTRVPELRFPEFRDAGGWEKKKLKEACEVNPTAKKLPNSFIYIDLESVQAGALLQKKNIRLEEAPSRAQRLLKKGDVIFQMVRPYQKNNFLFQPEDDFDYVASTGYAQLRANQSNTYLYQYIHNEQFVDRVLTKCTGSNYPAINSGDLSEIVLERPSLDEQQKIADCLSSIDELITAQTQKLDSFKAHKKGLMQHLFPAEGETVPKLRFPEFRGAGEWKERQLGDFSSITTGSSNREDSSLTGQYAFFDRSQDIRTSDMYLFDGEAIIVAGEGQDFVPKYFIGKFDLHQRSYAIMDFETGFYGNYFFYFVFLNRGYFLSQAVGSTVKSLRLPMFKKMPVQFPELKEQKKIADCLSSIDDLITSQAQKLDSLKAHKKGLMQQLFPSTDEVNE